MSRFKVIRFSALALASLACASVAQAQNTFDPSVDWKSTYSTSAATLTATQSTWGTVGGYGQTWSAGELSYNWTNLEAATGNSSLQTLQTYYNANSVGSISSAGVIKGTLTYTVPFQAYQFTPGHTFQQQVGQTLTDMIALGYKAEKTGGSDSTTISLPTNMTSGGALSGTLQQVGTVKAEPSATGTAGFTTTADAVTTSYRDPDGSVQSATAGVWYNYGSNATSTSLGTINMPASAANDTLSLAANFGPTYVAWTAPNGGNVTINTTATDIGTSKPSDGGWGFFVISTPTSGNLAPGVLPTYLMTAPQNNNPGSGDYTNGFLNSNAYSSTIAGSTFNTNSPAWTSAYSGEGTTSLTWNSGTFYVTTGETLYFVVDAGHNQYLTHGNHAFGSGTDGAAISAAVNFTAVPEPSSIVLLGMAGVGFGLAAWKRRRNVA